MLLERPGSPDVDRATGLLQEGLATATALGMVTLAEQMRALLGM